MYLILSDSPLKRIERKQKIVKGIFEKILFYKTSAF